MDNITFLNNPQDNSRVVVYTNGTHVASKAAKLDNNMKRPVLVDHYNAELAKMVKVVENVASPSHGYDASLGRLGITTVYYDAKAQNISARKLKVKGGVVDKGVLAKYNKAIEGMKPSVIAKEEKVINAFVPPVKEEVKPVVTPVVNMEPVVQPLNDTRVGRLERTGEIPVVRQDIPSYNVGNNVINTPDRFINRDNQPSNNVVNFPSRMERAKENEVSREDNITRTAEIGKGAKELDKINTLIHGNEGSDLSVEIQNAHRQLEAAMMENKRVVTQSATLEEQIKNVKATVEQLKKEKAEAQQRELDKTLDMIEATKEENLGATRRMTNLQAELAELIRQRDEMLNDNSYSRGRVA